MRVCVKMVLVQMVAINVAGAATTTIASGGVHVFRVGVCHGGCYCRCWYGTLMLLGRDLGGS